MSQISGGGGGTSLTESELETLQAIDGGTYFIYNETPSGSINGSNTAFTLASTPSPATSLILTLNGQVLKATTDFTLSEANITMTFAPRTGSVLLAKAYTVAP